MNDINSTHTNPLDFEDEPLPTTGVEEVLFSRTSLTSGSPVPYESLVFHVHSVVNPLVACAAPLLNLTSHLRVQNKAPNGRTLNYALCHEIKVLEQKAQERGYRSQIILGARYLICALIDETILNTEWGQNINWTEQSLLQTFQHESWGGDRFFLILERSSEDPKFYIDLIELGYLCISLGFRGKYRLPENQQALGKITDDLYHLIRSQRGEFSRRLFIAPLRPQPAKKNRWILPPTWFSILLTGTLLISIFIPYHLKLQKLTHPLMQLLRDSPYQMDISKKNESIQEGL